MIVRMRRLRRAWQSGRYPSRCGTRCWKVLHFSAGIFEVARARQDHSPPAPIGLSGCYKSALFVKTLCSSRAARDCEINDFNGRGGEEHVQKARHDFPSQSAPLPGAVNHEAAEVNLPATVLLLDEEKSHWLVIEIGSAAPSARIKSGLGNGVKIVRDEFRLIRRNFEAYDLIQIFQRNLAKLYSTH